RHARGSTNFLRLFGRLNPGVNSTQAGAELTAVCRSLKDQFPVEYARKLAVRTMDLREQLVGDNRQPMLLLMAAVLVVLGAALANLVSLALVRANERRTELSIRIAIGASRFRLVRHLMGEPVLWVGAGCGRGWLGAIVLMAFALPWAPSSIPRLAEVNIDAAVAGFAGLLGAAATLILTVAPLRAAMRATEG